MRQVLIVIACVAVCGAAAQGGEVGKLQKVEQVLVSPPATGLVVIMVQEESQAEAAGIELGDTIVRYDETPVPTLKALGTAKALAEQSAKKEVQVDLVKPDGKATVTVLAAGQVGVDLIPVEKGKSASGLPEPTKVHFDTKHLATSPHDDWYGFSFGTGPKIGFEHSLMRLKDGKLHYRREVAFDGGRQFDLNHMDVTITATTDDPPRVLSLHYEFPLGAFASDGRLVRGDDGKVYWRSEFKQRGEKGGTEEGVEQVEVPTDLPIVPSWFVEALASLMTKEEGACFHFRPIMDVQGTPMLRSCLFVVGPEKLQIGDQEIPAWRVEQRRMGGHVASTFWIDATGKTLRSDYGGPVATISTREEATANIHPDFEVRSGK